MVYILAYLVMGMIIAGITLEPGEEASRGEIVSRAFIAVIGWPLVVFFTILQMFY